MAKTIKFNLICDNTPVRTIEDLQNNFSIEDVLDYYRNGLLRRDHKARGFYDIGYHFYIRKDGKKTQLRMLLEVGAHCIPYNRCSIGICYEGGLDEDGKPANTLTKEQEERITDLLINLHKLFPKAKIVGHRDLPGASPKECPCFDAHTIFGWIEDL